MQENTQPISTISGTVESSSQRNKHRLIQNILQDFPDSIVQEDNPYLEENNTLKNVNVQLSNNRNILAECNFMNPVPSSRISRFPEPSPALQKIDSILGNDESGIEMIVLPKKTKCVPISI